jgi:hypothetical protein
MERGGTERSEDREESIRRLRRACCRSLPLNLLDLPDLSVAILSPTLSSNSLTRLSSNVAAGGTLPVFDAAMEAG